MPTSDLIDSLTNIRSRIVDLSLRNALNRVIRWTPANATVLSKKQVMTLFYAATDYQQITNKEIEQLNSLYREIKMSPSANRYLKDVIRHLKSEGGTHWKIDHTLVVNRKKVLTATLKSGKTISFGIRGTLTLDGVTEFDTLERPLRGDKRCIAPGRYTLRLRSKFSSRETDGIAPTTKNYTRIQVPDNQSERGGIQFHWGKDISWSDGCTLVGVYEGNRWIPDKSEPTYKALLKEIGGEYAYDPQSEDEWSMVPRVKLVCTFQGNPT